MAVQKTMKTRRVPIKSVEHADNVEQKVADSATGLALATVPDKRYFTGYISRRIGGKLDLELLDYAFTHATNVLIYGPTGPGKTSFTMAWAAARGKKFYSVASNVALDPSQMFGKMSIKDDGSFGWFDGGVTDIVRHGGVILINEVNFMSDRIAPVLFELLDKRREITLLDHKGEKIRAHRPDCWCDLDDDDCRDRWVLVVADMNPDYSGTRPLNAAFRNRFPIQIEWDYDPIIEEKLVPYPTLLQIARNIRKQVGTRLDTPVATNMLMEFATIAQDLSLDFAITNFCNHFTTDERTAVEGVFEQLKKDLEEDFTPDQAPEWDQFTEDKSDWMHDFNSDEDEEVEDDEED
jgi:MoxR-like ATPase